LTFKVTKQRKLL